MTRLSDGTFDFALVNVVPGFADALGAGAGVKVWTHGHADDDGKLVQPTCWNTNLGLAAFFGTSERGYKPGGYVTDQPLLSVTLREAVEVCWAASCTMVIDQALTWKPEWGDFERLMFDVRGWHCLTDEERAEIQVRTVAALQDLGARVHSMAGR